jgi:hypothetical protein
MLLTFLVTMVCTLFLAGVMIAIRYRIEVLLDEAPSPALAPAQLVPAQREPEPAR